MNLRYLLLPALIYGVPNALAFFVFLYLGVILVDTIPVVVALDWVGMMLVFCVFVVTFLAVLFITYRCANWFDINKSCRVPYLVGVFVFLLQVLTFFVALYYDFGRVGAKDVHVNGFALIVSYVKADFVFMIYYGHVRGARLPWANLGLYVISNVFRGWSSVWMVLVFVEVYCFLRKNKYKIPYAKLSVIFLLVMVAYPWINGLKESFRGGEGDYGYVESYFRLFNRLQHVSNVILIAQEASSIESSVSDKAVLPWYMFNTFLTNVVGLKGDPLQKYITKEYLLDRGDGIYYGDEYSWFTHVGVSGWLFLIGWYEWPLYILVVLFLLIVPYKIAKNYLRAYSMVPVLHVATFLYVLHGWLEVQVQFILAMLGYLVVVKLIDYFNFNLALSLKN